MKLCYCDESGTGEEPIATMVGIIVDAHRMHLTKEHWQELLDLLTEETGHKVTELHTRNFYSGSGVFRALDGETRASLIDAVFEWLRARRHHVVYSAVVKQQYFEAQEADEIPDELDTVWRFMGYHLILAMQYCQRHPGVKGHTLYVFDNEERERARFTDLIMHPPRWSDEFYDRGKKQKQLDQVIDVPYFGDSREVALVQLADFLSFFLRRYAEMKEDMVPARYANEEARVDGWIGQMTEQAIASRFMYPKVGRNSAEDLFFNFAPTSIRSL